ncbi:MAG: tetratricopeptide repeat protein [Anaerolineae bacterium]|nr:tetratricopeptide repeat protein [Anaerolineae bacterium]MCI0607859.1 tetratricopeptide repeat protein [Anaerolineae bacterium]
MNVSPRRPLFSRKPQSNVYRMFLWVLMLLGGIWMLQQINKGEIQPLFLATPTPTRTTDSYILEGDANFTAGNLTAAITAYEEAVRVNPNDAETWAKLARIQTYSSAFLITNPEKKARLLEARDSATKAVELAPEDSTAHAIRAFVLDWNANSSLYPDDLRQVQAYLVEAEQEALIALQLDNSNTLALAYYAEILIDQQKWNQAELQMQQALQNPDADQMDVHRINAYLLETLAQYNLAITEYEKAIALEPNFTFLYLRAGANYRRLAFEIQNPEAARPVYEKSLEYFDKAVDINKQIRVNDPAPHLSIARTYSQLGEFFAAARNVQKALEYEPTNADIYGQLGIIYFRSRNYEGSIFSFECAIRGCSGVDSCYGRGLDKCYPELGFNPVEVTGQEISPNTIVYYYTYGSVLAALSRQRDNKCDKAMQVLNEVTTEINANPDAYADGRETIVNIVQAGEAICDSLAKGDTPVSSVPTETGDVMSDVTATPTP